MSFGQSTLKLPRMLYCLVTSLAVFSSCLEASSEFPTVQKFSIDIHKVLGSEYACAVGSRSVQFLSEQDLLVLAGPTEKCFQSVGQLELVVLSLDGHIRARKSWPSTFPAVVLSNHRIAVATPEEIEILDDKFSKIQGIPLPPHAGRETPYLHAQGSGKLAFWLGGKYFVYGGMPVVEVETEKMATTSNGEMEPIFAFSDGRKLMKAGNLLITTTDAGPSKTFANLDWVIPCQKYCQQYAAGYTHEVVTGSRRRILFMSNGSRFPVTDAAGLFPYFRVEIFDLDTGTEIYREEWVTITGERTAAISPDGDLFLSFDGSSVSVRALKD